MRGMSGRNIALRGDRNEAADVAARHGRQREAGVDRRSSVELEDAPKLVKHLVDLVGCGEGGGCHRGAKGSALSRINSSTLETDA